MKKLLLSLSLIAAIVVAGCTTTQQTQTYKTLYTVEQITTGAYNGYLDLVVSGDIATNNVPTVSHAYNHFQRSYLVALDVAQFNTNRFATSTLMQESTDVINLINGFSH